jgi:metallo-beta-lactamase family protein
LTADVQGGRKGKGTKNVARKLGGGKLDAVCSPRHLDHVGRLPLLTRKGYEGPIYATQPTIDIATMILKDSLMLQKADLKRENQYRAREQPPLEPLIRRKDVRNLKPLCRP